MKMYPDYHASYDRLRIAVKEVWDAIGELELLALVREMPARFRPLLTQMECIPSIRQINEQGLWVLAGTPCR
jgi:hypothetical protein